MELDEKTLKELESLVLSKRIIIIAGEVNEEMASRVLAQLLILNCQNETTPITIYIRSRGGDLESALDIFDAISHSSVPIMGITAGRVCSAAVIILQGCKYSGKDDCRGKRIFNPNSRLLIHYGSHNSISMNPEEMEKELRWSKSLEQRSHDILIKASERSAEEIEAQVKNGWPIWPEQAIALGLADEIIEP